MTAKHAMLCYNPGTDQVAILEHPDIRGASDLYQRSLLACSINWSHRTFEQRKTMIFIEAWQAVVRDHVDPMALHRALLALDEYRAGIAEDMLASVYPKNSAIVRANRAQSEGKGQGSP